MEIKAVGASVTTDYTALYQRQSANTDSKSVVVESQQAPKKVGKAPPSGGAQPTGAQPTSQANSSLSSTSSTSSSKSSSTIKQYDERDVNQDGSVSAEEELQFQLQQMQTEMKASNLPASQIQASLTAYQKGVQANSTTTSLARMA